MAEQRKIVYTATLNASEVTEELADVGKAADKSQAAVGGGMTKLDAMTGGMITAFKGVGAGIKASVIGMKSLKGAIAATGIGLLIIAVAALASYFTKTQRGAEKLEIASAALGAMFDILVDVLSTIGEKILGVFSDPKQALMDFADMIKKFVTDKIAAVSEIFGSLGSMISKVFSGDFKGAMEDGKNAAKIYATEVSLTGQIVGKLVEVGKDAVEVFKEVAVAVVEAGDAASKLAKRSIQLRKDQRALNIEMSESRAQIKGYKLIAEDLTKEVGERIIAQQAAMDMETALMAKRVAQAEEERDIQLAKMALAESTEEDFVRLSELEVAVNDIRLNSLGQQKALIVKLNALTLEDEAAKAKVLADEQKALEVKYKALDKLESATLDKQTKEVDAVAKKFDALLELAVEFGYDEQIILDQQKVEVDAINKKWSDKELADKKALTDQQIALEQKVVDSKRQMTKASFGALTALNMAFSAKGEKAARAQFNRNKALGIAAATINTYWAISDALAKDATFPGSRFIAAAAAGVTGLAQVIKIQGTQFGSSTAPSPGDISLPSGGGGAESSAAQLDLGFLGQGSGTQMGRTYVVSQEVTTNQQADQLVSDQAALYQ